MKCILIRKYTIDLGYIYHWFILYIIGYSWYLPPVIMKARYYKSDARPGTSDVVSKIYVHVFVYPPDTIEATSTIIVMDEVLQQYNP